MSARVMMTGEMVEAENTITSKAPRVRFTPERSKAHRVRFTPESVKTSNKTGTALLLIDFQNEFTAPGGKLNGDVQDVMDSTGMLSKIPRVVANARKGGALVIHSPVIMKEKEQFDEPEFDVNEYSKMDGLFIENTWNAEFASESKPEEDDIILLNRKNFSAFEGTGLKDILDYNYIRRVFLMGFLSNGCIEETARAMREQCPDIDIYMLTDGSAAKSQVDHTNAITVTLPLYGNCITCQEAESLLSMKQLRKYKRDSLIGVLPQSIFRPRILALCGAQSNDEVTKLQLENLQITEENHDITYLRGQIEVEEGSPDLIGLVHGPFFSWLDNDETKLGESLIEAVRHVLAFVKANGPFHGIYGFSSGALVATLAAGVSKDPNLQAKVLKSDVNAKSGQFAFIRRVSSKLSIIESARTSNDRKSSKLIANFSARLDTTDFQKKPFNFAILACSAFLPKDTRTLRKIADIPLPMDPFGGEEGAANLIRTKSFHLVGLEDGFKTKSEEIASLFKYSQIMYLPGGHSIGRNERTDDELCHALRQFTRKLGNVADSDTNAPVDFKRMSNVSSIALDPHKQVAQVKLDIERLPEGLHANRGGATMYAMFEAQPKEKPFLYNARSTNGATSTYGDIVSFIRGGDGDLRRLGIKFGEVVAYGAPPGGSAAAALAFISIGAQTAAAPLAPSMMEPDVLDALSQFNARHLILFEGVDCPGVEDAFLKYAPKNGTATIHRARMFGDDRPGMFEYIDQKASLNDVSERPLRNPANGTCLLLRTSGTTARPKGVPLEQGALVNNGAILANSMGLKETDVCYSVMPLFHIGGISASILCTLAAGGSVCCDNEPFDPGRMVDAMALSKPQPTWYSSVPTIHNATVNFLKAQASQDPRYKAYGIDSSGVWMKGHSLRMIRSGAAALLGPDGTALAAAYGGVPIYPTYSMSEQMPISQPPAGKIDTLTDKPGSVGVPVAASTAIVSRSTLRPQPHGVEGEIAICGPTVLKKYLDNPVADKKAYFFLTQKGETKKRYFLTGDVGVLDGEGFLSLKGRAKELIKKGGEQVSPFEVEEPLLDHPWVKLPVCFAVSSKIYGEEVGCALVLSSEAPEEVEQKAVVKAMRQFLKEAKLAPTKWPTKWVICSDNDLPKTKTKKYIRVGLSRVLGLEDDSDTDNGQKETKAKIDWGAITGFRFFLACYVMFMHIGSNESWGAFNNLRGFPWHVHVFFTLGGFSLASPMNPTIGKKFSYFLARIGQMYPMYIAALVFGLINLLVVCRPSTFRPSFHWDGQPDDLYLESGELAPLFCEGTPATPNSYWGSLALTVLTYVFGLAVTPFWPINWWMGYYLWFSSMYYQCLAVFPVTYNYLFNKTRKNTKLLLSLIIGLLALNAAIIAVAWFTLNGGEGFGHYDKVTGEANSPEDYTSGSMSNIQVISFYLFGPFWLLYFVIGACTAFLYDAYRPAERHSAYIWGWVADTITLIMITLSILYILQGTDAYGEPPTKKFMRPDEANQFTDNAIVNRLWDNLVGRIMAPMTTLWVFSVSTGQGWTAAILSNNFIVETLGPNSYNCFLFHQMVGQWYFAATRNGHMWNWWRYRKDFYWFSPGPCPVEWYEYFFVVGLVVFFSRFMDNTFMPFVSNLYTLAKDIFLGPPEEEDEVIGEVLCNIIEKMTGIEPELDSTLEECGLASVGIPVMVGLLNKTFSKKGKALGITATHLIGAKTITDMVEKIEEAKARAENQGV